jgi:hypothetical protein
MRVFCLVGVVDIVVVAIVVVRAQNFVPLRCRRQLFQFHRRALRHERAL